MQLKRLPQDAMIPLFSAAATNSSLDIGAAIARVLGRNWYVMGEELVGFEAEFARYLGVRECVGVANGTDALELALRAVGVGAGDLVVTVANAGFYGSAAIHAVGAIPLYADVDGQTLTLSPQALARALEHGPKAVIVTHLYGQLALMDELTPLCQSAGVALIEDCAQAHGARRAGRMAGSFGDAACFSFYPTKNLGGMGDGGAVASNDTDLAARVRSLRQYGWAAKYTVAVPGGRNSRLDEIQAAILRVKLPHLDEANSMRRLIASRYSEAFADLPLRCPVSTGEDNVAHLFVVRTDRRDALGEYLGRRGIATAVHYPVPDTQQPAWPDVHQAGPLPTTEEACATVLTLPCFPDLSRDDLDTVIARILEFFRG